MVAVDPEETSGDRTFPMAWRSILGWPLGQSLIMRRYGLVLLGSLVLPAAFTQADVVGPLAEQLAKQVGTTSATVDGVDAAALFGRLVDRYRGLALYSDSVRLAHRTVESGSVGVSTTVEQALDCTVQGPTLDVRSSALGAGGSCDTRDESPLAKVSLSQRLWTLPHLALRFADEPLRSMQGGCGTLVPTKVEQVTVDARSFLRLHLETEKPAVGESNNCEHSTVDLFVNPISMLVERVEHSRTLAAGIRYEATLEITPERAVTEQPSYAATESSPPRPAPVTSPVTPPVGPLAVPTL